MEKKINGGYKPQAGTSIDQRGYQPLTEGYQPKGSENMPAKIPALTSAVQPPSSEAKTAPETAK